MQRVNFHINTGLTKMQHKWPLAELQKEYKLLVDQLNDLNIKCFDCKYYIENNPQKNTYRKDLCTNELNKQSALNSLQFMQVSNNFGCNNFIPFNFNDTENEK